MKQIHLHVTEGVLELCHLSLTLSDLTLQLELRGDSRKREQQSTSSPTAQPQQTSKEEPKKEEEGEEGEENILDTVKNAALFVKDSINLPSEALADFAIDTINLIPGVDIKKSKFQNDALQSTREVMSVVSGV